MWTERSQWIKKNVSSEYVLWEGGERDTKSEQRWDGVSNRRAWLHELNDEQNPFALQRFVLSPFGEIIIQISVKGKKRIKIKQVREMII